jgi:hypothetical protein
MELPETTITWTGFFQDDLKAIPITVQHMVFTTDGQIKGTGVNTSGPY